MNYFKNFLPLIFLFFTTNIIQAKRMGGAATTTQTRVQPPSAPAPVQIAPKPTGIQQQISQPKTYAEALNYIKTNMQASDVFTGNTFTQKFINFVKSLNLYDGETAALLQAGISLYAPWTGNDGNDKRTLYSLKNTIESIVQAQITMPSQPALPSSPKPVPQPNIVPPVEKKLPTISKGKAPEDLFRKVKKLEGHNDIYVGIGTSAEGETINFAMEKLDNQRIQVWQKYADALSNTSGQVLKKLATLSNKCDDSNFVVQQDSYTQKLLSKICPNKTKFYDLFKNGGGGGVSGFIEMLKRYKDHGDDIYVVYASSKPVTGAFKPKKEIQRSFTLEDFATAYSDIIICVCVDMLEHLTAISTEHRGIFKNPFNEIQETYRGIALQVHGFAGTVEKQFFKKEYMTLFPTPQAGRLLHRAVPKGGGLYLGTDKQPFRYDVYYNTIQEQQAIKEKFPPIKSELIGDAPTKSHFGILEDLHVFDLNALSKYYTEQ